MFLVLRGSQDDSHRFYPKAAILLRPAPSAFAGRIFSAFATIVTTADTVNEFSRRQTILSSQSGPVELASAILR